MNLFEHMHHYQLLHFLRSTPKIDQLAAEPGPFIPSRTMLSWLYNQLDPDQSNMSSSLIDKLNELREQENIEKPSTHFLINKGKPWKNSSSHTDELFQTLCLMIRRKMPIYLSYLTRSGKQYERVSGFAFRLNYYALRRQWQLIWQHGENQRTMTTPLEMITDVVVWDDCNVPFPEIPYQPLRTLSSIELQIASDYNQDLGRIYQVLSSFDKKITRLKTEDGEADLIHVYYSQDDLPILLSRLRMIGRHIHIIKPVSIREQLYETARKALERYQ
ncbi:MAG: hypothetical protein P0Y55_14130 [Candidatus Cohnella colombiensis]|uniref:WYL domain-containing protein n=1 Tax=Candidatus Cohnella colombiensis TaxID=3121368 RepID=A0AA95JB72_9BACL|nr:MAG: hypothetical protein P0Y55_14130 [Cohnella sp.]